MSEVEIQWYVDSGDDDGEWKRGTIEVSVDYAGRPSPHVDLIIEGRVGYVLMHEFFRALSEQYEEEAA